METKICSKCHEEKQLNEYHKDKNAKDGYRYVCKECVKKHNNQFYNVPVNKEKINIRKKDYYKNRTDEQKEKDKMRVRKYRNNPNVKEKEKEYRNNPVIKERARLRTREWSKNNKERRNNRFKNRLNSDALFKIKNTIRGSIHKSIKNKGYKKNNRTHEILGCSYEEFKLHLESKFESWMNWDNYGKYEKGKFNIGWDIDHIIPLDSATTEEELIKLNHFTNLQPLCSKINRDVKRNYLDFTL